MAYRHLFLTVLLLIVCAVLFKIEYLLPLVVILVFFFRGWAADRSALSRAWRVILADRERRLGVHHPDTLTARDELAYTYRWAQKAQKAIPLYQANLHDRKRTLGPNHPDTLITGCYLADAYMQTGQYEDAIPLYDAALSAWPDRPMRDNDPQMINQESGLQPSPSAAALAPEPPLELTVQDIRAARNAAQEAKRRKDDSDDTSFSCCCSTSASVLDSPDVLP